MGLVLALTAGCGGGGGIDGNGSLTSLGGNSSTLSWDPPTTNEDGTTVDDLAGYRLHYGTAPGNYTEVVNVDDPNVIEYAVLSLSSGTYFFAVTAYDTSGNESGYSNEVTQTLE